MAKKKAREAPGNYVSEWFGHRVYPIVVSTPKSLADQRNERCPFLSHATGTDRACIKSDASKGVCTINSPSNGVRQDWLVCPYRALNPNLVGSAVKRLFSLPNRASPRILPAVNLEEADERTNVARRVSAGELASIYFRLQARRRAIDPADSALARVLVRYDDRRVGEGKRYPAYWQVRHFGNPNGGFPWLVCAAVRNLGEGLRMHGDRFGTTLSDYQHWLAEGIEGPNIANVFKRTFYQMMFKFQLGQHDRCAGCVLAIPQSVWDSWQKHLGGPELTPERDGSFSLVAPNHRPPGRFPAWIFVFDTVPREGVTPSPIILTKVIGTDAPSMSYWALEVAPKAALSNISSDVGLLAALARRLKPIWPELAKTVTLR